MLGHPQTSSTKRNTYADAQVSFERQFSRERSSTLYEALSPSDLMMVFSSTAVSIILNREMSDLYLSDEN